MVVTAAEYKLGKPTDASQTTKHDLNVMLMEEICQDIYN